MKKKHFHASDFHGISRLAIDATDGLTDLVEAMHWRIIGRHGAPEESSQAAMSGISGMVYQSIRKVTGLAGAGINTLLSQLVPIMDVRNSSPEREAVLAALNGVLGDYLAGSCNPLAIDMRLRREGLPLVLEKQALAASIPESGGKLLVMVHGLCRSDLQWRRRGHDHGTALARDLGYTALYLHYNSGLHISINGREFSGLIEDLVKQWPVPVESVTLIGHSMGGLVARSACHYGKAAGHGWLDYLSNLVFIGTPHHGAPLERGGNWVGTMLGSNPYAAPFARLGKIRSAGITDLRYGNLVDEDWIGRDRFEPVPDLRHPVPLPEGVKSYAIAATMEKQGKNPDDRLWGDGLVPVDSALGRHKIPALNLNLPKSRQWIGYDMHHLDLLSRPAIYETLHRWLK